MIHSNSNSLIKTTSLSKGRKESKNKQSKSDLIDSKRNQYKNTNYLNNNKSNNNNKNNNKNNNNSYHKNISNSKRETIRTSINSIQSMNNNNNNKINNLKISQNSAEKIKDYSAKKNYKKLNNEKHSQKKENGSTALNQQTPAVPYYYNNINIFTAAEAIQNISDNSRLNTGNSVLNNNNNNNNNSNEGINSKNVGKVLNFKKNVKEDNYKNCLLNKVHKKTDGKYMILDYNSNSEAKKGRSRSNSSITEKV